MSGTTEVVDPPVTDSGSSSPTTSTTDPGTTTTTITGDQNTTTTKSTSTSSTTDPNTTTTTISSTSTTSTTDTSTTSLTNTTSTTPTSTSSTGTTTVTTPTTATTTTPTTSNTTGEPSTTTTTPPGPSTTTDPPESTTSHQETTSFTTFITTASNGQVTTVVSPLPSLGSAPSNSGSNGVNRTAIIAGSTVAGVLLLLLLLGAVFIHNRRKNQKTSFIRSLIQRTREGRGAGSVGLLDDEFDDDDNVQMSRRYRDNPDDVHSRNGSAFGFHTPTASINASRGPTPLPTVPMDPHATLPPGIPIGTALPVTAIPVTALANMSTTSVNTSKSKTPSLIRARASESGSIFHEDLTENVGQNSNFVDPLLTRSENIDFSSIVDNVMGPSPTSPQAGVAASAAAGSSAVVGRDDKRISSTGLPPGAAPPVRPDSQSSIYNDPFSANSSSSFFSPHTKETSLSSTASLPTSLLGLPAGVTPVKKSSPLATTTLGKSDLSPPPPIPVRSPNRTPSPADSSSPPSAFASPPKISTNWLERSPKRTSASLKGSSDDGHGLAHSRLGQAL